MKKKRLFIIFMFIFLFVVCFIFVKIFFNQKNNFLKINNENIVFIDEDVYVYNSDVSITCNKCYIDNKKVNNVKLSKSGNYELKYNNNILNIKLDRKLDFDVVDYYGNIIHNYSSNKLPFKIVSNHKIQVNDEKYISDTGFYAVGDYCIKSDTSKYNVSINNIDKGHEYDIYIATSTLQILYMSLIYSQSDNEAFMWVGRDNTINYDYLNDIDNLFLSNSSPDLESLDGDIQIEIADFIRNILEKDPDAYFNVYLDELRFYLEQDIVSYGLDRHRYSINYLTDGTLSYQMKNVYLDEKIEEFNEDFNFWEGNLDKYRANIKTRYISDLAYLYVGTTMENAYYYLQYPGYFSYSDKEISKIFNDVFYYDFNPTDKYKSLSKYEKQKFLKIINFDKDEFDNLYFSDSDKPYLILTGEVPTDYGYGISTFKNMIKYVVEQYGDDYNILFKPHPRELPNSEFIEFFKNYNIGILPGKMPMEAITFVYENLYLGGFPSSLYLSVNASNVLFFFANDKNEIFEPIRTLLSEEFSNVKILEPNKFEGDFNYEM